MLFAAFACAKSIKMDGFFSNVAERSDFWARIRLYDACWWNSLLCFPLFSARICLIISYVYCKKWLYIYIYILVWFINFWTKFLRFMCLAAKIVERVWIRIHCVKKLTFKWETEMIFVFNKWWWLRENGGNAELFDLFCWFLFLFCDQISELYAITNNLDCWWICFGENVCFGLIQQRCSISFPLFVKHGGSCTFLHIFHLQNPTLVLSETLSVKARYRSPLISCLDQD